jgi:predicted TIM-barrel fold metal-dependent hydrolase
VWADRVPAKYRDRAPHVVEVDGRQLWEWDGGRELTMADETPICIHIGSGGAQVTLEGLNPMTEIAAAFTNAARSSVNLMVSPLLRKYPDAKVVWSEGGIGWIPAAIERADRQWERHQYWTHLEDASIKPSDVARESMYFCMIEEPIGIKYRYDFRVDRILWESDYPHADTPFPKTQMSAKEVFEGVPQDEIDLITHQTAEALFHFPLSQKLIDAYSAPGA